MKTTATTTLKTGLHARYLTLLLAALTVAVAPQWASVAGELPFKGSAEGAVVSASPGPAGVLLTVRAEGQATHSIKMRPFAFGGEINRRQRHS